MYHIHFSVTINKADEEKFIDLLETNGETQSYEIVDRILEPPGPEQITIEGVVSCPHYYGLEEILKFIDLMNGDYQIYNDDGPFRTKIIVEGPKEEVDNFVYNVVECDSLLTADDNTPIVRYESPTRAQIELVNHVPKHEIEERFFNLVKVFQEEI